jgi:hypothetical protein
MSAKSISLEICRVTPEYSTINEITASIDAIKGCVGKKVIDQKAHDAILDKLGRMAHCGPLKMEDISPDILDECVFTITQEMIDSGVFKKVSHRNKKRVALAFIIKRPLFNHEISNSITVTNS